MAGTTVTITLDDAALRRTLGQLLADLHHPARALRDIGEYMVRATDERFRAQHAPDGTPWAPNSDVTLLRYLQRKGGFKKAKTATGGRTLTQRGARLLGTKRVLRDSGALQGTIRSQLAEGGRAVAIGTNRIYGAMQQFGGTRAQWPHLWGDIPARPFLGVSPADAEEIMRLLTRHLDRRG
jgi:phage virion morphogenesis protein